MKHTSCKHFGDFITMLENDRPGFLLKNLAQQLGCTPERIRRMRLGDLLPNASDLEILYDHYNASLEYLVKGIPPMQRTGGVAEPQAFYQHLSQEVKMLKQVIHEKDKVITLYEKYEGVQPTTGKKKKK